MKISKGASRPNGIRMVVYGVEGIGKTTLASKIPDCLFYDLENGTHGLDVAKIADDVTMANILGNIAELKKTKEFKTIVFDTADKLEGVLLRQFCEEQKIASLESVAYHAKDGEFKSRFAKFLDSLSDLANAGVNVMILAHAETKKFEQPDERGAYDRWTLKMLKMTSALIKEWADLMIFCNYKINVVSADKSAGETKSHATGGKRWCYTAHTNAYDAKRRSFISLPDDCSLDDMQKKLPKAIDDAVSKDHVSAKKDVQPKTEDKKEEVNANIANIDFNTDDLDRESNPKAEKLMQLISQHDVDIVKFQAYAQERYASRYGENETPIAKMQDEFLDWLIRGVDKIALKLK